MLCSFFSKLWLRYKKVGTWICIIYLSSLMEVKARYIPRRWGIFACFALAFVTGFHEYGLVSVIEAIVLNGLELNSYFASPISMAVQGLPYLVCVFPLGYWIGHRYGHKTAFTVGLVFMYLYGLYSTAVCVWTQCTQSAVEGEFPLILPGIVFFVISLALMYYNMMLLCLDQLHGEGSVVHSVVLHWMQVFFFAGEFSAFLVVPFMFKFYRASYGYILILGIAVSALLFIMWSPMELGRPGHRGHPFKLIFKVLKAAGKECCHGVKKHLQKLRRGNIVADTTADHTSHHRGIYSRVLRNHSPNCFERIQVEFGGYLPGEDVRDVQQFCLICLMLLSFIAYHMVFAVNNIADLSQIQRMSFPPFTVESTQHMNFTVHSLQIPVAIMNTVHSSTSVLTLILCDRVINPLFGAYLRLRTKIGVGLLFSFASSLVALTVEAVRTERYLDTAYTQTNSIAEILEGPAINWPAVEMSLLVTVPQFVLFGIANALVQIGALELSCLSAPYALQPFSFSIYLFTFGVAQLISAVLIVSQRTKYWCFYCHVEPSDALSVNIAVTLFSFLMLWLYWILSYLYQKLEWAVHKPVNEEILESSILAHMENESIQIDNTSSINSI